MKDKFCGYVIDSVDYKDNDSIVTVLSSSGLVSFKARGAKKVTSKMNSVLFNYAYSEFEVNESEKSGYLTLLDGHLLDYPNYVVSSLEYMTLMGVISEGVSKCLNTPMLFDSFKDCLKLMEEGVNGKIILVAFLNYLLENEGMKYEADGCLVCHDTRVASFSFAEGGFFCKKCAHEFAHTNELKEIRMLTKIDFKNANRVSKIGNILDEYIEESFNILENNAGFTFKGKDFLLRVFKMGE